MKRWASSMLRKIFVSLALAVVGLMTMGSVAFADPGYGGDDDTGPAVGVSGDGTNFVLGFSGFTPGEPIEVVGSFTAAAVGLRGPGALALRDSGLNFTATADANGSAAVPVTLTVPGTYTFNATGLTSGVTASVTVVVSGAGTSPGAGNSGGSGSGAGGTGGAAGAGGSGGTGDSSGTGGGSGGSGGSASSGADSGLAYTGASLAGPLAIGIVALLAGLALLFFGTRGVIRRKGARSAVG